MTGFRGTSSPDPVSGSGPRGGARAVHGMFSRCSCTVLRVVGHFSRSELDRFLYMTIYTMHLSFASISFE